ncbi:VOC family protein [Streptomyces sp. SID3343]|uniref:VOC family protein n=1 Tax=Streptomyces sp. SID3343 TaxID=2690260 RepID=UPI00136F1DD6|nr:VOC family protein [Streptomyces sp. SID3343]MYW04893.1 VOC family protein [Streptomyces sp. SID3343]
MNLTARMITIDCADPATLAAWWAQALNVEIAHDYGDFVIVGAEPLVLGFQRVPDDLSGKNRVHVDFHTPDRQGDVERLVGLGASIVAERSMPGLTWTTLRDPAGNEFCVAG